LLNIVITGAAGGLGKCLAEVYLKRGDKVFGLDVRMTPDIKYFEETYGSRFVFCRTDVRYAESIAEAVKIVADQTDAVDILYNDAAILPENSAQVLEDFIVDASLEVFSVNTLGPMRVIKALLPLIKKGEAGVIVNISSEAGSLTTHNNYINRYDYCMSKAALNMQTIIMQRYLKQDGIKLFAVHPGWMRTEMGGPKAPLLPEESAEAVYRLVHDEEKRAGEDIFFDYDGTVRPW